MINNNIFYPDTLITVDELSKMSGISKSTLYHDIYKSKKQDLKPLFPYIKLGGKILFRSSDIQNTINNAFSINKY